MQYIGARYVPKFMGTFDITQSYENMCVVDNGLGTSYISTKPAPAGTPLTDTAYWAIYGASSGAIVNLQNQIDTLNGQVGDIVDNEVYISAINYGIDNTGNQLITSLEIREFLDAAIADNKIAYFPEGTYKFYNSVSINKTDRVRCHPRAVFDFADSIDNDGVILNEGYYTNDIVLGEIQNATNGAGVKLKCSETVNVTFKFIHDCKYGVELDSRVGSNERVSGNTINGDYLTLCDYGIYLIGDAYAQEMQQNTFNIKLINTCTYGIYFSASTQINWAYNTFNIGTIFAEPTQTNSYGIIADDAGMVNHMTFNVYQIYGGFKGTETLRVKGDNNVFKLAYLQATTRTYEINVSGYSCYFENLYGGDLVDVPVASKYSNILGSWNSGYPLCGSNFDLDLPIDVTMNAGDTKDLYFYHSFAFGHSDDIVLIPKWASAPMICTAIEDESLIYGVEGSGGVQRQIHIRLLALGNVAADTYRCRIKYNG